MIKKLGSWTIAAWRRLPLSPRNVVKDGSTILLFLTMPGACLLLAALGMLHANAPAEDRLRVLLVGLSPWLPLLLALLLARLGLRGKPSIQRGLAIAAGLLSLLLALPAFTWLVTGLQYIMLEETWRLSRPEWVLPWTRETAYIYRMAVIEQIWRVRFGSPGCTSTDAAVCILVEKAAPLVVGQVNFIMAFLFILGCLLPPAVSAWLAAFAARVQTAKAGDTPGQLLKK